MLKSIEKRLGAIEARIPLPKSEWDGILPQCSDEELSRLEQIIMKLPEVSDEDFDFVLSIKRKYGGEERVVE